jgi:hypothetical protein
MVRCLHTNPTIDLIVVTVADGIGVEIAEISATHETSIRETAEMTADSINVVTNAKVIGVPIPVRTIQNDRIVPTVKIVAGNIRLTRRGSRRQSRKRFLPVQSHVPSCLRSSLKPTLSTIGSQAMNQ